MSKSRTFTPELKARVVLEELTGVKDKAEICREHRLRPSLFSRWQSVMCHQSDYNKSENA